MKGRWLIAISVILFILIVITRKNDGLINTLLAIVNPIKQTYINMSKEFEDKGRSYLYQEEYIEKLNRENKVLRKYLLEQKHYIQQVKDLFDKLPSLQRIPRDSVEIVQTISYFSLNSFSTIILTKPDGLDSEEGVLFGLIQNDVVAGIAHIENGNLYGALTSNKKCIFSVFLGKDRIPGIAYGLNTQKMEVKFIPRWSDIKKGDKVVTSGIDNIFFANIPVGVIDEVKTEGNYKIAYIKSYADILHPDYLYLITDPSVTLVSNCKGKDIHLSSDNIKQLNNSESFPDVNKTQISSIPTLLIDEAKEIIQTTEEEVSPKQLEVPLEKHLIVPKKYKPKKKYKQKKKKKKKKYIKKIKRVQPRTNANDLSVF
ncbi:Rod shape-determining protein MreC [hydrothermal vent metagenome]|uniref:Rod shape-determining protein MreC n=1 Tax=hydrothermal vent metagenome TaxID=652676 RepID=A0A1W1BTI2_9ZZZZ